jgi:hypothetical protein
MATLSNPPLYMLNTTYQAADFRAALCAAWLSAGVIRASSTSLKATQLGTPALAVQVAAGYAVLTDNRGAAGSNMFLAGTGASQTQVALATADATNPRIDLIVIRVRNTEFGDGSTAGSLEAITGTPAVSPAAPATPNGCVALATVAVGANATQILTVNITDARTYAVPVSAGVVPRGSTANRPATGGTTDAVIYQNTDSNSLEFWNGSAWTAVGGGGTTMYGASATGTTVASSSTYDSAASITFTTTAANTKWLIELDAQVSVFNAAAIPWSTLLKAKVDGTYVTVAGWDEEGSAGYYLQETTLRGRCVVTLATAASHTILAAVQNRASTSESVGNITITATQLS